MKKYNDQYVLSQVMMTIVFMFVVVLILSSCAIVNYEGKPDGSTNVSVYSLGSDKVLNDFSASKVPISIA